MERERTKLILLRFAKIEVLMGKHRGGSSPPRDRAWRRCCRRPMLIEIEVALDEHVHVNALVAASDAWDA
jgi:hypothetical protein